jgi:hypothetical protein
VTLRYIAIGTIPVTELFRDLTSAIWPILHSGFIIQKRRNESPDPDLFLLTLRSPAWGKGVPEGQSELPARRWQKAISGLAIWIILAREDLDNV